MEGGAASGCHPGGDAVSPKLCFVCGFHPKGVVASTHHVCRGGQDLEREESPRALEGCEAA